MASDSTRKRRFCARRQGEAQHEALQQTHVLDVPESPIDHGISEAVSHGGAQLLRQR